MEILLYFVLVLALVGDVLLAILLVRSSRPQKPQGPTADDVVNAMTPPPAPPGWSPSTAPGPPARRPPTMR